jgi:hypothetical protein
MPGGLAALDIGFPRFTGRESTEQKLAAVQNYLYMLLETLRYTLSNLDTSNWNKRAMDDFVEMIRAGVVVANTVITNTVITQNLYAEFGDIAELTCDRLLTANKVSRYKDSDTADINFVWIQGQSIKLMTGTVVLDGATPQTTQHSDRNGNLLYWYTAEMLGMSTTATAFPVTVYQYTELCKASLSFDLVDGVYVPRFVLGAGTGVGDNDRLVITKPADKAVIKYTDDSGNAVTLEFASGRITGVGNTGTGFGARNIGFGADFPASGYQDYDMFVKTS